MGIQSRGDVDAPYWPVQSMWTYKEIWVHPVTRWVWLLKDIAGPALVEGRADSILTFSEITTGQSFTAAPGTFSLRLPEGEYRVDGQSLTFLPGGRYYLDLRRDHALAFEVSRQQSPGGAVTIRVTARGQGTHGFAIRTDNLAGTTPVKDITLKPGIPATFEWKTHVTAKDEPWVALVVPDGNLARARELRDDK